MASSPNIYRWLVDLLPSDPLLVGQVEAHHEDGTSTVTLPGGGTMRVRGTGVPIGSNAFVQGGVIQGAASPLQLVTIVV